MGECRAAICCRQVPGGPVGDDSRTRRLRVFWSLAGNKPLLRVVVAYALFIVTEYSVWLAMLVYAYRHGGATVAGLVAVAQLVPTAVLAPFAAAVADRWSPVDLLAGGYLGQAVGMAATAAAVLAGVPLAAYAAAVFASALVTTTRPAQATLIPSVAVTPGQLTASAMRNLTPPCSRAARRPSDPEPRSARADCQPGRAGGAPAPPYLGLSRLTRPSADAILLDTGSRYYLFS
jgi:hypothetical protein